MTRTNFLGLFLLSTLLLVFAGCGNGGILITGTVKFADGTPVTTGQVVFDSATSSFAGTIDGEGKYKTGGVNPVEGIPAGSYTGAGLKFQLLCFR